LDLVISPSAVAGYTALGIVVVILVYGFLKQPDFLTVPRRPRYREVIVPGMIVSEVIEILRKPPRGFSLYQLDPAHGLVVYLEGPGLISLGCYYPLYVDPSTQGVLITCGIEPRTPLYGPPVRRRLVRMQRTVAQMLNGVAV